MRALRLLLALAAWHTAYAQTPPAGAPAPGAVVSAAPPASKDSGGVEAGWHFGIDPKKEPKEEPAPVSSFKPMPKGPPPEPKEESCKKKATWTADCGFVNPGTDFEFQAKQRDALMERMVVSQNDPKAVEDFQYYMRWALERTAEVTNLWYYNMVQNPELDPTVTQPVNTLGLRMMTDVQRGKESEFTKLLKEEGAFLIYFSRHDCRFCHAMAPVVLDLAKALQVPVRNAALDDKCIPGLEAGCEIAPRTTIPAQALQVGVVPTVFLYVPPATFIRVGTGVTDGMTMKTRALQFFQASRAAMLKGVRNAASANRASVDFAGAEAGMSGTAAGVPAAAPRVPTEQEMARLLNAAP